MGFLFGLITAIPGLAGKFFDWQAQKANIELQGFSTASGIDLEGYRAYLSAQVETNRLKIAQNSWWGAKLIIMIAGVPASLHFAAVFLDSLPFLGHVVGSWHIPKVPAPYDGYQWAIVQSFFIVVPAMPVVTAVSAWLSRKR